MLVEVLRVGVDGTDKEINAAEYGDGAARGRLPGHRPRELRPRAGGRAERPGHDQARRPRRRHRPPARLESIYDGSASRTSRPTTSTTSAASTCCTATSTEHYVEDATYVVPLPESLREVGVLLEPTTIAEKGINQAFEIQRRLRVWQPRRAAVLGAGTIGLLATLLLRLRGLDVVCYSRGRRRT